MSKAWLVACAAAASMASLVEPASATVTAFLGNGDLAAFNTAAGNPPITIDFDSIAPGTNISTLNGLTFTSPTANPLTVVDASTTTSFCCGSTPVLIATSGANVLSPGGAFLAGGPDPVQQDALQIDFAVPVAAFGLDMLFQSLDESSNAGVTVYGPDKTTVLFQNTFLSIPGGGAGGGYFVGFVSNDPTTNIGRIVFNDDDNDFVNPDSNLGYDTLRFAPLAVTVPEPATMGLLGIGLAAFGLIRRRRP